MTNEEVSKIITNALQQILPSKEEILDAIKDAITESFYVNIDVPAAISKGISDSMPYPSEIQGVFYDAVLSAVKK